MLPHIAKHLIAGEMVRAMSRKCILWMLLLASTASGVPQEALFRPSV